MFLAADSVDFDPDFDPEKNHPPYLPYGEAMSGEFDFLHLTPDR